MDLVATRSGRHNHRLSRRRARRQPGDPASSRAWVGVYLAPAPGGSGPAGRSTGASGGWQPGLTDAGRSVLAHRVLGVAPRLTTGAFVLLTTSSASSLGAGAASSPEKFQPPSLRSASRWRPSFYRPKLIPCPTAMRALTWSAKLWRDLTVPIRSVCVRRRVSLPAEGESSFGHPVVDAEGCGAPLRCLGLRFSTTQPSRSRHRPGPRGFAVETAASPVPVSSSRDLRGSGRRPGLPLCPPGPRHLRAAAQGSDGFDGAGRFAPLKLFLVAKFGVVSPPRQSYILRRRVMTMLPCRAFKTVQPARRLYYPACWAVRPSKP